MLNVSFDLEFAGCCIWVMTLNGGDEVARVQYHLEELLLCNIKYFLDGASICLLVHFSMSRD